MTDHESSAPRHQAEPHRLGPTASAGPASVGLVLRAYRTEYAIYGTVLVSALIAVGWKYNTDLEVLIFTVGTIGVFWLAHIYSGVVAGEKPEGPRGPALWHAALGSARTSVGMVLAMLLPAFFLLLATLGILDEYVAYYIALWTGVAVLAALGWANSARRGNPWPLHVVSAAITSALGLGVIWLSTLVH